MIPSANTMFAILTAVGDKFDDVDFGTTFEAVEFLIGLHCNG